MKKRIISLVLSITVMMTLLLNRKDSTTVVAERADSNDENNSSQSISEIFNYEPVALETVGSDDVTSETVVSDDVTSEDVSSDDVSSSNDSEKIDNLIQNMDEIFRSLENIREMFHKYNTYDISEGLFTKASSTHAGITYTWDKDVCTVSGTSTGYSVNIMKYYSLIPKDIIPGETLYVHYHTTNPNVMLRIMWRDAKNKDISREYLTQDSIIHVPVNAAIWTICLFISPDMAIDHATVSDFFILNVPSNKDLSHADDAKAENDELDYINAALGIGRKIIKGHFVNSSGVIVEGQQYDLCCFYVKDKITQLYCPSGLIYAFFTSEPQIGSTSYNNSRTVSIEKKVVSNLPVPDGTNWIALRVPAGGVATISPISTELDEIKDMFLNTALSLGEYTDSLDNVKDNSVRYIPSSVDSSPFYGKSACVLYTSIMIPGTYLQTAIGITGGNKGKQYARTFISSAWTDWATPLDGYSSSPLYFAFGDSVTWGAVWTPKDSAPYYQIKRASTGKQIPTRIAHAIGADNSFANKGVSGAYFVGDDSNRILTAIQKQNLSDAKIVTIAGGRNDSSNPLGDTDSTIGDGTICGAVKEIIEYLQSNYNTLQIVWIGVTPHSVEGKSVFVNSFSGGWSMNDFDEQVGTVCAQYCVPYIGWKECSLMMHWSDFTSAAGNYVHPDSDDVYLQMGNYIAGRVASYYRG